MNNARRVINYRKQRNNTYLTPKQRRRMIKKSPNTMERIFAKAALVNRNSPF